MNKYIDAEKLKELIQPCYKYAKTGLRHSQTSEDYAKYNKEVNAYEFVFRKINYLQKEQPEVDLEEAARNSWFNYEFDCGALYSKCYKDGYKAGANWQREQFHDACYQCEKDYYNAFYRGEQQLMKVLKREAITGEIMKSYSGALVAKTTQGIDKGKFKFGDKVKVIILKDE